MYHVKLTDSVTNSLLLCLILCVYFPSRFQCACLDVLILKDPSEATVNKNVQNKSTGQTCLAVVILKNSPVSIVTCWHDFFLSKTQVHTTQNSKIGNKCSRQQPAVQKAAFSSPFLCLEFVTL